MTNDLNTIPASVRDVLPTEDSFDELFEKWLLWKFNGEFDGDVGLRQWMLVAYRGALYDLIERLCQPNIVIVDLDDEKLVEHIGRYVAASEDDDFYANTSQEIKDNRFPIELSRSNEYASDLEFYNRLALAVLAALAALKEKP